MVYLFIRESDAKLQPPHKAAGVFLPDAGVLMLARMKTIYARYNRHRLPPFQIETSIVLSNGEKTVVKRALTPEATNHIREMRSGYDLIKRHLAPGSLGLPRMTGGDEASITFQYIEGVSVDRMLFDSFRGKDKPSFLQTIDNYCALVKKAFPPVDCPPPGVKMSQVFGMNPANQVECSGGWLPVAAADAVFENIIINGNSSWLIDNEWVFDCPLPLSFLFFRSLFYFHRVKCFEIGIEKWVPFDELLERCGITPGQAQEFRAMDESFQAYVYGAERCYKYKESYKKREIAVHALEQTIEHQRGVVRKYHEEIVIMRQALAEQERIINEIVNSFGWKLWRKITGVLEYCCPAGSRRRRMADRLISALKTR